MWSVVLKILSILGIILLALLGTLLAVVLLVLFMPVAYRGSGFAHGGKYQAQFRFRWLFGLVRGEFSYPEDGALRIRALWVTLFDSGRKRQEPSAAAAAETRKQQPVEMLEAAKASPDSAEVDAAPSPQEASPKQEKGTAQEPPKEQKGQKEPLAAKLSALREKLRLYLPIVQDEDNRALVRYALGRLGRILRSIRPRVLRLEAVIGTGEPDTTGYIYGAFRAVKPFWGRKCRIAVTPDFESRILEGEVFLRGHILAVVLLYHIVRVILDKRLGQLIDRLKQIQR